MPNYTPNLNLAQPLVNNPTDADSWGGYLNANFGILDNCITTSSTPTFTNPVTFSNTVTFSSTTTVPTASQFDNSTKAASTAYVTKQLGNFAGITQYNADTTLTVADIGKLTLLGGSGTTMTLPLLSACVGGSVITLLCEGGAHTVQPQGSNGLVLNNTLVASIAFGGSDFIQITNAGSGTNWIVSGGAPALPTSSQFVHSLAASGYQKFPAGLILQWGSGSGSFSSGSSTTITLPTTFPNAIFSVSLTGGAGSPNDGYLALQAESKTTSNFVMKYFDAGGTVLQAYNWMAVGN